MDMGNGKICARFAPSPAINLSFPHHWQAQVLAARPLILPQQHFVYPREVEEVEHGALEIMARSSADGTPQFLATCALGFRDAAVPTGVWSCPNPDELCAVAGGYAYVIDTAQPERFTMLPYRPVLDVRPVPEQDLLLFVGHRGILAWGSAGQAWESGKLSDEGVTIAAVENGVLRGMGWDLVTDREMPFAIDLRDGRHLQASV
jgi:hypothetical protein